MSDVRVRSMTDAPSRQRFVETFCEAPQHLRRDPYRVGLLSPEADALFLTLPFPVPREFWAAERGGKVVGRVGASVSSTNPKRGTVGFFECDVSDGESASALLSAATGWLREREVETAYGPVHINTWFPYRFRTGGTDDKSYSWEPVNPPEYPAFFEDAGFVPDMDYHSELMADLPAVLRGFEQGYRKSIEAGYEYRALNTGEGLESEIPTLYRLSVAGFANNYLFDPISEPVFRMLYVAQARKRQAAGCYFVSHPDHGEVGFSVCFLDEAGQFVFKTIVVLPEHQSKGLSFGLVYKSLEAAAEAGHQGAVGALLQTGNRSEAALRRTSLGWNHRYVLYRKALS